MGFSKSGMPPAMSKTLITLIAIMNLIPVVVWGYAVTTDLHNKNTARQLLNGSTSVEGSLVIKDEYIVRGAKSSSYIKTTYGYLFVVDGKPQSGVVSFAQGRGADESIRHIPAGGAITVVYDQKDPSISMPANVARYYLNVSPWRIGSLFQMMLIVNGCIAGLIFCARYREQQ